MANIFYWVYCIFYLYFFLAVYRLKLKEGVYHYLLLLIILGLFYDNFISSIGFILGEGPVLKFLNFIRYIIHAIFTPLICLIAFKIARAFRVKIAQDKRFETAVWVFILALMVLGFIKEVATAEIIPATRWGMLNYVHAHPSVPVAAILVNLFVIIVAVLIWKYTRWPGLFITSILMFMLAAAPSKGLPPILGNAGEVIFIYGFILAEKRLSGNPG
jgi:uncharacterized membrane protein